MLWWIVVIGAFLSFLVAWGLGGNDVATAFGPSVGSRALTLGQAIMVAFIVESAGAVITGRNVVDLYDKSGMMPGVFEGQPVELMLGMCSTLAGTLFYLTISTYLELPISTAHTIIGGIVGFTVMDKGMRGVNWERVGHIMLSTVTSPLLAATVSLVLFVVIRLCILRREHSLKHGFRALPFFYGLTVAFLCYFFIYHSSFGLGLHTQLSPTISLSVCGAIGLITFFLVWLLGVPLLWQWIDDKYDEQGERREQDNSQKRFNAFEEIQASDDGLSRALIVCCMRIPFFRYYVVSQFFQHKMALKAALSGVYQSPSSKIRGYQDKKMSSSSSSSSDDDTPQFFKQKMFIDPMSSISLHSVDGSDEILGNESRETADDWEERELRKKNEELYSHSEGFDARTEDLFSFLQILSASVSGFAHGSFDVSNASAPFVIILALFLDLEGGGMGIISEEPSLPWWILGVAALSIFFGLLVWGYKIMASVGYNCTLITPSRGFNVDFGSSVAAVVGSRFLNLHMNSTYCIVGSVFGVGLADGHKAVNWRLLLRMWLAWVCTVPVCGMVSAVVFILLQYTFV